MNDGEVDKLGIRPEVADALGYYVYAYVDPRNAEIFYIGKGCGARALAHIDESGASAKVVRIAQIQAAGLEPRMRWTPMIGQRIG